MWPKWVIFPLFDILLPGQCKDMHEGVQIGKKLFEGMLQENYQANSGLQKDVSLPNPQSLEFETFQTIAMNLDQTGP